MAERLSRLGVRVDPQAVEDRIATGRALGRWDVAALLVQSGRARSSSEAVTRFLRDGGPVVVPKQGLPVAEAIQLIQAACGVCSWAHPPVDATVDSMRELREMGLDAVEVEYPTFSKPTSQRLRELASICGLAVSGGSDCHGPTPTTRAIGTRAVSRTELNELRSMCRVPKEPNRHGECRAEGK
jgi:predicted metal-dependent phosphoesterase TrpH